MQEFPAASLSNQGLPLPGTQVRIFNPNEEGVGEICVRGRHIFMGYLNDPNATQQCFDSEGFYHTGDSGFIDPKTGNIALSGRIKELIITSGGENVAPIPIELSIKDNCPIVSNCVVVGDGQRYLSVLLTLRVQISRLTGKVSNELAPDVILFLVTRLESKSKTVDEVRHDVKVLDYIQ